MKKAELKAFLDEKAQQYERPYFIPHDPIQIPHRFQKKEDIEIAAFLTATISWGNRKSIITNATKMMDIMHNSPHEFILNYQAPERQRCEGFVHRTFNAIDLDTFFRGLQHIYHHHGGLENVFARHKDLQVSISEFKKTFFSIPHQARTMKHVSDPLKGSAAKRLHMFLRWMVRDAAAGVDFGIWHNIQPSQLSCPLDVHTGNVARKLGLLSRKRKQNDAKSLTQLDKALRRLDAEDPVKYDFALFGLGAFEGF